ncbi:MAG: GxxExxY protein [Phycisphaerae bacterium]|nr:GxxExxY protein [Phycisphaerae bacterium]
MLYEDKTKMIIGAFYDVYNSLGFGFLEKVYENALAFELEDMGFNVQQQQNIKVYYRGIDVGTYFADIVVDDSIIIELKTAENICDSHKAQLKNYLQATKMEVGLLLNFGPKPEFSRTIFSNNKKNL